MPPALPSSNRWLLTFLAVSFGIDVLLSADNGKSALGALPGAALMVLAALLGARNPAEGAVAGSFVMFASTVFVRITHTKPESIGIVDILLSETIAGVVLVVFVAWRCRPLAAAVYTSLLVSSAVFAMFLRTGSYSRSWELRSLQLGVLMLLGALVIGIYLRGVNERRTVTELGKLVRGQWPLAAGLALALLLDLRIGSSTTQIFALGGAVIASVCAFFAPRAPVMLSLAATIAIALSPFILYISAGLLSSRSESLIITEIAASMALTAYAIRWGPRWPAILSTGALVAANMLAVELRSLRSKGLVADRLADSWLYMVIFFVIAVATGLYFRSRDRERAQSVRSAVTGAQQSERLALARELHDVVAHHVTGIVVQAQAAKLVSDRDPQIAVQALDKIETSGVEALKAMRFLVASMRGAKPAGTSEATEQATTDLTADLTAVVENFGGPPVLLDLHVPDVVPQEVGRSVLRLVQESLTNVGKHALGATTVLVEVTTNESELHVRVTDNGTGRRQDPVGGSGGYGLVGMRERVELLGGRFSAGPAEPVGWQVDAWLPVEGESTT